MNTRINILFAACILALLNTHPVQAQPEQVRFAVNMEHANLDPGDQVVVRGNHTRLGNWGAEGELVLRQGANPNIYRGNVRLDTSGQVLYKYVIKKAGGAEVWEHTGNRVLDTSSSEPAWFSDRSTPGIRQLFVNVTVRLDLSEHTMDGLPAEGVALMGLHEPLSFDLENGRREMSQTGEGLWEVSVAFPVGTPHDVPFKFAYHKEGEWIWEWRPGHANHVFWIDDSGTEQTITLKYDIDLPGVIPATTTTGFVDDYEYVITQLGEKGPESRYGYELAMQQLRAGNRQAAEATYANYAAARPAPGADDIDDFDYELAYHIQRTEGAGAAERFVEGKLAREPVAERRSYLRYLRGELALRTEDRQKARRFLRQARQTSDWELVTEYSQRALIMSYLQESNPDSVQRGVRLLRRVAAQAPPEKRRSYALQLARAYRQAGMIEKQEEVLHELATRGNARQQTKGKLDLAGLYMEEGRYSEALGLLDAVEFSMALPERVQLQLTRQRIRAYFNLERYARVIEAYQAYAATWPDDAYAPRMKALAQQAGEQLGTGSVSPPPMETATADSTQN